jgi:hypothetical protein
MERKSWMTMLERQQLEETNNSGVADLVTAK